MLSYLYTLDTLSLAFVCFVTRVHFFLGIETMIDFIIRGFLCLHGFLLGKQGISYINVPRNDVLISLLKKEGLEGPGLDILVPFLGITYVTIGSFNLLAAVLFSVNEACYILIASGFLFHIGIATVRSRLDPRTYNLYKPGIIPQTNRVQFGMGVMCMMIGIIGCFYI